jgi:hypothetical protein
LFDRDLGDLERQVRNESRRVAERLLALPADQRVAEYVNVLEQWRRTGAKLHPDDRERIERSFRASAARASGPGGVEPRVAQPTHVNLVAPSSPSPVAEPKAVGAPLWLTLVLAVAGVGVAAAAVYVVWTYVLPWISDHRVVLLRVAVWMAATAAASWTLVRAFAPDRRGDPMAGVALLVIAVLSMIAFGPPGWIVVGLLVAGLACLLRVYVPVLLCAVLVAVARAI